MIESVACNSDVCGCARGNFRASADPLINSQVGQHVPTRKDHPRRKCTPSPIRPCRDDRRLTSTSPKPLLEIVPAHCRVDPLQRSRHRPSIADCPLFDLIEAARHTECVVTSSTNQATCLGRSAALPVLLLSEMRSSLLLGSLFSPRFKPLIPSFETHSRDGPFRRQG